jgi:alpha-methylacyl-CoA racemase
MPTHTPGPLAGLLVVELAGIGPGPHAAMILADHGADVLCVQRPGTDPTAGLHHTRRNRRVVSANLKDAADLARVRALVDEADVLIEGFRPGVAERLGIGPDACLAANPRLVYARMTGWGQTGPLAQAVGHDINYLSLTGALHAIGTPELPLPPLGLVGDFGGGSMLLVNGILMALVQRQATGRGSVVDAAMVDGVALLEQLTLELREQGLWTDVRGANLLDGGAPFYRCYRCADDRFVAVGAIEPGFYGHLVAGLGLDSAALPAQYDTDSWPALAEAFAARFATRTRDEWAAHFEGVDACVTPVLTFDEAPEHPHIAARGSLYRVEGSVAAAPAPRFG